MMKRQWLVAALVGAVGLGFVPSAFAGDPKKEREGEALNNEGRALANQKKWEEARKKFEAAYGKVGSPGPLFNLAWAEQNLGMHRAALKHYRIYLELPPTEKINADAKANAQKFAAECAAKLCTFEVRGASKVTVDGEAPSEVEPGSHKIEMDGAQGPKSKTATCAAGEKVAIEYEEKSAAAAPTVAPPPTATSSSRVADPPPPEKTETGSWLVPGVLGGIGLVGIGVGVGLGAASSGAESDAAALTTGCTRANPAGCTALRDADAKTSGLGTGSVIGYVAGGAFLGAALVTMFVQQPWKERRVGGSTVRLVPGLGGAMVLGTF